MAYSDNQKIVSWQQTSCPEESGIYSGAPSSCGTEPGLFDNEWAYHNHNHNASEGISAQFALASKAVPELIALLNDEDQVIVSRAASVVLELTEKDASIISSQLIEALITAISNSNDLETTKTAVVSLYKLSHRIEALTSILNSNGIVVLVNLLGSAVESVLFYAITTIHNLLLHKEDSVKTAVKLAGGLPKLVALLRRNNAKFLTIVTDCLQILAYGDQDSKLMILAAQGPVELVRIMRIYEYEKLLLTTSKVLRVLSACPSNKIAIVEAGGVHALAKHLSATSNQRLIQNCLSSLRNLSDAATKLTGLTPLLIFLIQLLESSDDNSIVICALGILCNLTCNNHFNKQIVCQNDGVPTLVRAIVKAGGCQEIIELAVCTLRHLTGGCEEAHNQIRTVNGIPVIVNLLNPSSDWSLLKVVIGLIRNLALSPDNLDALRESCTVNYLIQLSIKAYQEAQIYPGSVEIEAILEIILGALQVLAKDVHNREQIQQNGLVAVLVQLLLSKSESLQQVVLKLLCKLALDKIELVGATDLLTQLAHSNNEGIATYAASLLFRNSELQHNTPDLSEKTDFEDFLNFEQAFEKTFGSDIDYQQQVYEQVDFMQEMEPDDVCL